MTWRDGGRGWGGPLPASRTNNDILAYPARPTGCWLAAQVHLIPKPQAFAASSESWLRVKGFCPGAQVFVPCYRVGRGCWGRLSTLLLLGQRFTVLLAGALFFPSLGSRSAPS